MTTIPTTEWREHLAGMITDMRGSGALTDPHWAEAFHAVPRHVFTPHLIDPDQTLTGHDTAEARHTWLSRIYQDDSLVTAVAHHPTLGAQIPTSSSTRPGLMASMLELLDLHDGMRVLEIGTGTGYNAGLLTHRLGAQNVTSIDVDSTLIEHATRALRGLDLAPHLIAGDGTAGAPDRAPFDRIIATCAVSEVPLPWISQLAPGGKILVNLRGEIAGGTLCLLTKDPTGGDEIIGPFLNIPGHFMWARRDPTHALPYEITPISERNQNRIENNPETVTEIASETTNQDFRFLAQLHIRGIRNLTTTSDHAHTTIRADAIDGSWVRARTTGHVTQGGNRRLWDSLIVTHALWRDLGQPPPTRFGIVANFTTQFAYFDHDHNWTRWPLPLL